MLLLLMHMLLLSGVVSTCPADDNPLILDPPEILMKYGKELLVNCTTINYDFNEMYWSDGMSQDVTKDTFISWRVSASDWNVKASCAIKLNDSIECRKDLKITVYKGPDRVDLRPLNSLVEGRQQQLLCDVINVAPVQNLTVRWYKDDTVIMSESFNRTTKTPVNQSSALSVNVSRGQVEFRCEAQLDFDSVTLVTSDLLNVSVHYAPELTNISEQALHVEEGDDVTLTCEIDANPPPQYHWTRDGENTFNPTNSLSIVNILASANYSCTATNYLGSRTKRIYVYVSNVVPTVAASAPVDGTDCSPTLTPSELVVRFGDAASIECNISVSGFLGMGWEAPTGGTGLSVSPFATWTVDKLEVWDPKPFCFVTLLNEQRCVSAPSITVYKGPDRVDLRPLNSLVEGRQQQLLCDVINVAPVQNLTVRWYKDDTVIMSESFNRTTKTPVNQSSALSVNVSRGQVEFRCEAQLDFDSVTLVTSDLLNVSVHYAPELTNISEQALHVEEGDDVTLTCEIDANPPPQYHWTRDGENTFNPTNSLSIVNILASANYSCTATNYLGSRTKRIYVYVSNVVPTAAAAASAQVDGTDCSPTLTPSELVVRFGDAASIECNISVSGFLGMGWEAPTGGTGLSVSPFATWTVDKLEVWDPKPFCFVTLLNEQQCVSAPSITVYKTPDRVSLLSAKPMVEGIEHLLRCDIVNVAPVQNLTVRWYRGSEPVHTEMFQNKHADAPKTPQNQSFILRVSPERGHNGARYRCEAELHLGPEIPEPVSSTSQPYIAVVHFAPTFTCGNRSEEISLGGDVTFGCHVEGNPDPEVHWFYASADNVRETTWGRQKNITIQQATSTNAGHYICVATNEVGMVTRLVTVTIKDEGGEGLLGFSWWYLPLIIISAVIVFFVVTVFHCHKKHGRYSFISVRTNEEIPLGTKSAAGGIY